MDKTKSRLILNLSILIILVTSLLAGAARAQNATAAPKDSSIEMLATAAESQSAAAPAAGTLGLQAIPITKLPIEVDGICSPNEYGEAVSVPFTDGNGQQGTVFLVHNGNLLYVCMSGFPGSFDGRFGRLYLDPQGDGAGYVFADKGDVALQVDILSGALSSYRGTGVSNGWVNDPSIDPFWNGAAKTNPESEVVEYAVSFGRLFFGDCERLFGVAVYHHWFAGVGDDYGWPSNQWFDQPRTWQLAYLDGAPCTPPAEGLIAYVFRGNTLDAVSFYNLLVAQGYTVDLIPVASVLATDFSPYQLIIIADDSGDLDEWPHGAVDSSTADYIFGFNKPTIGIGEGGYAYFGEEGLFVGWPNGWHGPDDDLAKAAVAPPPFFAGIPADPVVAYTSPYNTVAIYLGVPAVPPDVIPVGIQIPEDDHSNLIFQNCNLLWGISGNPLGMTADGEQLFLNAVGYMLFFQCPSPRPPDPVCVDIQKTAVPAPGSTVGLGTVIEYTLTIVYNDSPNCENPQEPATVIDFVPTGTFYVPGSASDGISPTPEGALVWSVNPSNAPQTKTFKVRVADQACAAGRTHQIYNVARLLVPGFPTIAAGPIIHPVECPPIELPNDDPPFVEDEVQIYPYPLIVGEPSQISVRVHNNDTVSHTVTVDFQTSPDKFGIGLDFSSFDSSVVTIPAGGNVIVNGTFVPAASGHYCIQIRITVPGYDTPIITQRNIDVTEELLPGVPDDLSFKVRNNSTSTADITLVVDNTCPGWTAVISTPPTGVLEDMAPDEVRTATLTVTPPNPVTMGSGCHIDVQGWIGDVLIGGIRKLDVPPVHLPPDVIPPWEEREITTVPTPPIVGYPGQACVRLQNPTGTAVTVNIEFLYALFGVGIPFTPIGNMTATLPPFSNVNYCIPWTPTTPDPTTPWGRHFCLLVRLTQTGYEPMTSQRNVDAVRLTLGELPELDFPFIVFNPDLVEHKLDFRILAYGLDPNLLLPAIVGGAGDPPPDMLGPGMQVNLRAILIGLKQGLDGADLLPANVLYGDRRLIQVGVLLDGVEVSGFTIELEYPEVYLPIVNR